MAIVRTPNSTGSQSNTTLSGNISLEQGTNELVSYTTVNNTKVVSYKIDTAGIHYYNSSGVEISRIAPDGVYYYDTSGHLLTKISPSGFDYYDTNGVKRISVGASSSGMMRMLFYDADGTGRTIVGQNPNGGDQVVATSIPGHDVETELNS